MTKFSIYVRFEGRKSFIKLNDTWIEGEDLKDAKSNINESKLKNNLYLAWGIPVAEITYKKMKNQHYYD